MNAITTERRDQVLVVHLDDGKANALSFDMIDGILTAIREAESDDQIGAVVVHGREGKFSAGFDLGVMMADDQSAIVNLVANGGELVRTLYGCSVPVVAASTGHALAAGALMLLGAMCASAPTFRPRSDSTRWRSRWCCPTGRSRSPVPG